MAVLDVETFFGIADHNLSSITWAHAVNSIAELEVALASDVNMLEADVLIGTLIEESGNTTDIPIMAHPPNDSSDLSLENFLTSTKNNGTNKGVKLDFKTIEAFEGSVDTLKSIYDDADFPIWINADILQGPYNSTTTAVDAAAFFTAAAAFPNSTLSVGWTTAYGEGYENATYTDAQIEEMLTTLAENGVNKSVTFPVRAGIAAESVSQMQTLLDNITDATLTIWSSEGDPVDVTELRTLLKTVGLSRTYIDVPEELEEQLELDSLGAGSMVTPMATLVGLVLIFLCIF